MTGTIDKGLALFLGLLREDGTALSTLAVRAGVPASTAQRHVAAFLRQGLLSRTGRGQYGPGLALAELAEAASTRAVLIAASRAPCQHLAQRIATTVHLGVLEGDMVTYLVKEHGGGPLLRTREANQLEAYCTGIGKVLLAALDPPAQERYLAAGPFVQLTPATVTNPVALREAIRLAGTSGHAADRAEFEQGLYCLAVPVRGAGEKVVAALSASSRTDHCDDPTWHRELHRAAQRIGTRLGAVRGK